MNTISKLPTTLIIALTLTLGFTNCKTFKKLGKNFSQGAVQGLREDSTKINSILTDIISNVREEALGYETRKKVDSLLIVVTTRLRNSTDSLTTSVRDSLLSEYTELRLKEIVLSVGDGLDAKVGEIRDDVLGARTRALVAQLRAELIGDSTLLAIAEIRNELLGERTEALVDSLLKSSINRIARGYREEIKPEIKDTLATAEGTVKETINYLAWALGLVVAALAVVVFLLWRKFSTRKRIMRILTQEIDRMESQDEYDRLVGNIKHRTASESLEPAFQEILKEERLYQQEDWINKDKQLLKELSQGLSEKLPEEDLNDLHQKLEEKGLKSHLDSVRIR